MKRVLLAGGSLLVLAVAGALVAPSFIDWSKYKQPAIDAAKAATGYDITVDGAISLSILPSPRVKLGQVTVRLPEQSGDDHIASLESLNVAVALFPLLSGKVEVSNVQLVKPDIRITYDVNGEPLWATPKMRAMMGMTPADGAASPAATAPEPVSSEPMALTINDFGITGGHIIVSDQKAKATYEVSAIDANLSLDSLKGPFDIDGALTYKGVPLKFTGNVGEMGKPDMPVEVTLKAADFGTTISYKGAATLSPALNVQGQLDVDAKQPIPMVAQLTGQAVPAPNQPIILKTLLSATPQNVVMDNLTFAYGDLELSGSVKTRLPDLKGQKPMVQARLSSSNALQITKLMSSFGGAQQPATAKKAAANPNAPIELPVDLDASITAPAVIVARDPFQDVTIKIDADKTGIKVRAQAAQIPGRGKVDVTVYPSTENTLTATVNLNVADPVALMRDGVGMAVPAGVPLDKFKNLTLITEAALTSGNVSAKTGSIKWSGGELSFAGSGYKTQKNGRGLALVTLGGGSLNLDELLGGKPAVTKAAGPLKDTVLAATKNIAVPMDVDFSVSLGSLTTGGQTFKDLTAVGQLYGDALTLSQFQVGDYQGVAAKASGKVASIKNLTGIDMKVSGSTRDAAATMKRFGMTPPALGRDLGAGSLDLTYQGTIDAANVDADVTLWGVRMGGAGPVRDPLGTPAVDQLKVSISAANAVDAFRIVQPDFKATAPLQGPLKVTADTTINGKVYGLKNLNGTVGTMTMKGDVRADMSGTKTAISGGLTLGDVPLDALMGVQRTTAAAATTPTTGARWSNDPINTDWMRMMNLDFTIAAKSLTYNMWQLSGPTMAFDVKDGVLTVSDAQAGLFGGKLTGGGTMSAKAAGQPIAMNWNGDMSGVNARSLTNAFLNKAMNKIDGTVGLTFKITANGSSPSAIINGLNGQADSSGKDVTVNGIDVAKLTTWLTTDLKPTTTLAGIQDSFFGNGATTFAEHIGQYTITSGIVHLDQMLFDGAQASLNTTGSVSLPAWTIKTSSALQVKNPPNTPVVNFALNGSLSNPVGGLGKGLFQSYMQQKLQGEVEKLVEKKLGNKLQDLGLGGLLGGSRQQAAPVVADPAPQTIEPAAQDAAAPAADPAPVEVPKKVKPEDMLLDVLKGLGN